MKNKKESEKSLLDCDWARKNFSKDEVNKLKRRRPFLQTRARYSKNNKLIS